MVNTYKNEENALEKYAKCPNRLDILNGKKDRIEKWLPNCNDFIFQTREFWSVTVPSI